MPNIEVNWWPDSYKVIITHKWKFVSRDVGEIMVLHVVSYIEGNVIERSIVRICLMSFLIEVMLWDEVTSQRMKTHGHHRPQDEIDVCLQTEEIDNGCIEDYLDSQVDDL